MGFLHYSEDNIGLVADGGKGDGCDHDDHEVENPVRRSGKSISWCANLEWNDFSGVEP